MENVQLTLADMASMKSLLEVACNRGTFKAAEMRQVGELYEKLSAFIDQTSVQLQTQAQGEQTA